jgi:hypothetical protein
VRRRRGRPRKGGRSGDLVVRPDKPAAIAATMPHRRALGRRRLISWLRVSLAVWRCVASSSRCWRPPGRTMRGIGGGSRAFVLPEPFVARWRQQRLKDGRGADLENAVSEYCRHFCSG